MDQRCNNCAYFHERICMTGEPDAIVTSDPMEANHCRYWEEVNWSKVHRRTQATQQRVTRVQEGSGYRTVCNWLFTSFAWEPNQQLKRWPTREQEEVLQRLMTYGAMWKLKAYALQHNLRNRAALDALDDDGLMRLVYRHRDGISWQSDDFGRRGAEQYARLRADEGGIMLSAAEVLAARQHEIELDRRRAMYNRERDRERARTQSYEGALSVSELQNYLENLPPARMHQVGDRFRVVKRIDLFSYRRSDEFAEIEYVQFEVRQYGCGKRWVYQGNVVMD